MSVGSSERRSFALFSPTGRRELAPAPPVCGNVPRFGSDAGGSSVELGAPALSLRRPTKTQGTCEPEGPSAITSFRILVDREAPVRGG